MDSCCFARHCYIRIQFSQAQIYSRSDHNFGFWRFVSLAYNYFFVPFHVYLAHRSHLTKLGTYIKAARDTPKQLFFTEFSKPSITDKNDFQISIQSHKLRILYPFFIDQKVEDDKWQISQTLTNCRLRPGAIKSLQKVVDLRRDLRCSPSVRYIKKRFRLDKD